MKKFFKSFLVVLLFMISVCMVACNNDGPGPQDEPTEDELFWDKDGNGVPDWQEEEVTISYATWAYNDPEQVTIDTLLVDAFMEKYPNITVEMKIVGEDAVWDESMLQLLEANDLPDVFLVRRMENFLPYGILADLTEMYNHDPDTDAIFDSVKDLGLYKNRRYVVPTYIYPQLWIVNLDILKSANIQIPSYNWTWELMESIAQSAANDSTHTIGIYGTAQYFYEYAKVIENKTNPDNGWYAYGYNGTNFNFLSNSYLAAMNGMEAAINAGYLVNAVGEEQLLEWYGDGSIDPRYSGHVAIWREASWSVKEYLNDFTFDFDVYPAPSGVGMGNTDIAGVSSLSEHKEAAYQLLKWMSYSEEGIITRYELYEEYSEDLFISGNNYPYPVVDYGIDGNGVNKVWESIPYGETAPGLVSPEFTEALRNAAMQANKEVIGWDAVDTAVGEYFAMILSGESDFASLREVIQDAADQALADKREAIDDQLE